MNSFYGGKQGRTYHIVQRYDVVSLASLASDTSFIEWTDLFPAGTQSINIKAGQRIKVSNSGSNVDYYIFEISVEGASSNLEDHLSKIYKLTGMVDSFSNGGSYTGANYGEYVLIDTVHVFGRSNLENGLLYRRGFNYQEQIVTRPTQGENQEAEVFQARLRNWMLHPGAGAIYIGQIIGPMGLTPEIELVEWDEETAAASSVTGSISYGKDEQGNYNDDIRVSSITVRDEKGDVIGAQITFDIPKPVFEIGEIDTNPYGSPSITESADSIDHPFYNKWDFTIPGGKKGNSITGLGIEGNVPNQVLSATITNYDSSGEGTSSTTTFPWRIISNITPEQGSTRRLIIDSVPTDPVSIGDIIVIKNDDLYQYLTCVKEGTLLSLPSSTSTFYIGQFWHDEGTSLWQCIQIPEEEATSDLKIVYTGKIPNVPSSTSTRINVRNLDYLSSGIDGKIYAKYTDEETSNYLTTLNSVRAIDRQGDSIIIAYADPSSVSGATIQKDLIDPAIGTTFSNYTWHNLGTIPAQYHVQGEYTYAELFGDQSYPDADMIINRSFVNLVNGFDFAEIEGKPAGLENRAGWLVTVTDKETGDKHIFAFDYLAFQNNNPYHSIGLENYETNSYWYEVMTIEEQILNPVHTMIATDNETQASKSLSNNGYWFVVS